MLVYYMQRAVIYAGIKCVDSHLVRQQTTDKTLLYAVSLKLHDTYLSTRAQQTKFLSSRQNG